MLNYIHTKKTKTKKKIFSLFYFVQKNNYINANIKYITAGRARRE